MTADALVRLAELRRRQGRLTEATALLDQIEPHGLALLGRAELAYDRGDCSAAAEQAARYLRRVPTHNRTDRASGLDSGARERRRGRSRWRAGNALVELMAIATIVGTVTAAGGGAPRSAAGPRMSSGSRGRRAQAFRGCRRWIPAERRAVRGRARPNRAGAGAGAARIGAEAARGGSAARHRSSSELKAELELARARDVARARSDRPRPDSGRPPRRRRQASPGARSRCFGWSPTA